MHAIALIDKLFRSQAPKLQTVSHKYDVTRLPWKDMTATSAALQERKKDANYSRVWTLR